MGNKSTIKTSSGFPTSFPHLSKRLPYKFVGILRVTCSTAPSIFSPGGLHYSPVLISRVSSSPARFVWQKIRILEPSMICRGEPSSHPAIQGIGSHEHWDHDGWRFNTTQTANMK